MLTSELAHVGADVDGELDDERALGVGLGGLDDVAGRAQRATSGELLASRTRRT